MKNFDSEDENVVNQRERKKRNLCKGIDKNQNQCGKNGYCICSNREAHLKKPCGWSLYCKHHKYFNKFTEEIVEAFWNGIITKGYKKCIKCNHWNNDEHATCDDCLKFLESFRENKKSKQPKCIGKNIDGNQCIFKLETKKCCKNHAYMENYTTDMLNNLLLCSGCRKYKYIVGYSTCEECRNR
jgi:hypothetical protein